VYIRGQTPLGIFGMAWHLSTWQLFDMAALRHGSSSTWQLSTWQLFDMAAAFLAASSFGMAAPFLAAFSDETSFQGSIFSPLGASTSVPKLMAAIGGFFSITRILASTLDDEQL